MQTIIPTLISLINSVAVIVVIAYFLTRSKLFRRVLEKKASVPDRLLIVVIFDIFANVRDRTPSAYCTVRTETTKYSVSAKQVVGTPLCCS